MASYSALLDDTSPLITYSTSGWYPGTDNATSYFTGTYTFSNSSGSTATITFNGTGISIYGSTGPANAPFSIQIDGGKPVSASSTNDTEEFQQLLYTTQDLPLDNHTITIVNEATDSKAILLALDYFQLQTQLGQIADQLTGQIYQAQDSPPYSFSGPGWNTVSNNPSLQMKFGQFTNNPGDSFNFQFEVSNAVQVFGSVCPTCGSYQVRVDDGPSYTYDSTNANTLAAQTLFFGSSYDSGSHVLKVTKSDPDIGKVLIVDHVQVEASLGGSSVPTAPNTTNAQEESTTPNPPSPSKSDGPSSALIGGLCAALAIAIIIFGISLFLYRRRKYPDASSTEKPSIGKIEAFYIDVDAGVRSSSRARHTHTRSNTSLLSNGILSLDTSRTAAHDIASNVRSTNSHRTPRQSSVSANNSRRSDFSRDGPPRRRRTLRNSRILRAGYNLFFAHPGSSISGSNLAPTTAWTTEISERPPTTLSPVSEAPPLLPPSNRSSDSLRPESSQRLHVVNLSDD